MAEYVVDSAFTYFGALDLSPWMQQWNMSGSFETLDKTTMRNTGARRYKAGLITTNFNWTGLHDTDSGDPLLWAGFQARSLRTVIAGNVEAEGQPCVLMQVVKGGYTPHGGQVGQLSTFNVNAQSCDRYGGIRGTLLVEQQTVSTTGAKGTGVQAGAVGATQQVFAGMALMGTAGSSITVVLESDDNSNFTSATTRIAFGAQTAVGGYWGTPAAGAITDDWWRIRVTAVSGSWTVGAAMAIE